MREKKVSDTKKEECEQEKTKYQRKKIKRMSIYRYIKILKKKI